MSIGIRGLLAAGLLAAGMTGATVAPSQAQQSVSPSSTMDSGTATTMRRAHRRANSPRARDVGPDSTVPGGVRNDLGNANSGLPRVPGAPTAGGDGSHGGGG